MKTRTLVIVASIAIWLGAGAAALFAAPPQQASATEAQPAQVDLNAATAEELARLPGIGAKVAARIVAYREENGGFEKPEELMNVKGIGEKTFLRIQSRLRVGARSKNADKKK